jgi:hypothetical protein
MLCVGDKSKLPPNFVFGEWRAFQMLLLRLMSWWREKCMVSLILKRKTRMQDINDYL